MEERRVDSDAHVEIVGIVGEPVWWVWRGGLRVEKSLEEVSVQEIKSFLALAQNDDGTVVNAALEYVRVLAGNSGGGGHG